MSDRLVALSGNPAARKLAGTFGVSLPPELERDVGPWKNLPLQDRVTHVILGPDAQLATPLAHTLAHAGAEPAVLGELAPFVEAGEPWGRPARALGDDERPWCLIVDASGVTHPDQLRAIYDGLHPRVRGLAKSGRVVVLARPHAGASVARSAAQFALHGFVRSLGRELGRKGQTANLVVVRDGAEDRLESALRFLLSPRSVYVSGQVWTVSKTVRAVEVRTVRPLDGQMAVVTGGARGIGAATARALAREGAKVLVLDHPTAEAQAAELGAELGGAHLAVDVTDEDAGARIVDAAQALGGLDIVVHNAGVTRDKTLGRMPEELWDLVLDVNLAAILRMNDAIAPAMGKGGRMVVLSSIAGIAGNAGQTNYAASKAGVIGMVQALGPKLARRGIAVNAVAPGFIETRMTAAIPVATREVARRLSNLSQGGQPQDVAEVITFLSSPGAQALCGQVLRVCGGNFVGA